MNAPSYRSRGVSELLKRVRIRRGMAWGILILVALIAFEIFNYCTTEYSLQDVLGDLRFAGIRWATILALAFCGIDFAGIARLFTPEKGRDEPAEVWYLFGAWLLAAAMNAILTWWGVSVAIASHNNISGGMVVSNTTLTEVVPVFVAVMVWLIRVLIIGTFSVAGERLFSQEDAPRIRTAPRPSTATIARPSVPSTPIATPFRATPRMTRSEPVYRPESTYHNLSTNSRAVREAEYVDTPRQA